MINQISKIAPRTPAVPSGLPALTEEILPVSTVETVIRPGHHPNDEISFFWTPGIRLVELVYQPGAGLRFAVKGTAEHGLFDPTYETGFGCDDRTGAS